MSITQSVASSKGILRKESVKSGSTFPRKTRILGTKAWRQYCTHSNECDGQVNGETLL